MAGLLGHDFSRVRVHRDDRPEQWHARAFTVGDDIVLGTGVPDLRSRAGRRTLAHELTHVVQQRLGGPAPTDRPDSACERDAEIAAEALADGRRPPPVLRGTAVGIARQPLDEPRPDPSTLTNEALLAEISATRGWLRQQNASTAASAEREAYLGRLEAARSGRVRGGQLWLTADQDTGRDLLVLRPTGSGAHLVMTDDGARVAPGGTPGTIVVTDRQLAAAVRGLDIPLVEEQAVLAGLASGSLPTAPLHGRYRGLQPVFARRTNADTLRTGFTGALGEYFYQAEAPGAAGRVDLNLQPWRRGATGAPRVGSFPIFDFAESTGELVQIKTSAAAVRSERFGYYDTGFRDITRTSTDAGRRTLFDTALWNLDPTLPAPDAPSVTPAQQAQLAAARDAAIRRGRLAVNADDVGAYRATVARRVARNPATNAPVIEAFLRAAPVHAGGTSFTTLAQINAAPPPIRQQALTLIGDLIANTVVVPGRVETGAVQRLQQLRTVPGLDPPNTGTGPRPDIARNAWPELLASTRQGTGAVVRGAAGRGGALGGPAAIAVGTATSLIRTGELPSGEDVVVLGTSGTVGGAATGAVEPLAQNVAARQALRLGVSSRLGSAAFRGVGGGVAAGPVSAFVELGTMGYYDFTDPAVDFTRVDYFARGGRALVVGGASGLLSTALTAAIFGATLGPAGFVVGFLLGVGAYLLTDYLIGERVESGLRDITR